uniref:hypothetical protein n=1 Tax=Ningiella ruwaisensis TaxID=2364274 RepID=UPI00109F62B5|nr:hypothetical protein [Ningiella ruwaisensis]
MNKIINIILSGLLWRKYKFLLVSLIALIVFVLIVGQVHQDYLAYAAQSDNASVGWSFILKWLVWIIAIFAFFLLNNWYNKRKQSQADKSDKNSALARILSFKKQTNENERESRVKAGDLTDKNTAEKSDPFAHLRQKDKLRSYADLIIEKHQDKK